MIRRLVFPLLLLLVAVGLGLLPQTAAVTRRIDRPPSAMTGPDPNAALGLASFDNAAFTIQDTTFSAAGSVRNNFSTNLSVTVTVTPTVTQSCSSVTGGVCTPYAWNLYFCLSSDPTVAGTKQCRGRPYSQLTFTGAGPETAPAQSFSAMTMSAGQTFYLFVRGAPKQISGTSRLCGQAVFAATGTTSSGQSVQLGSGTQVLRCQIYRQGSGCP
ncbi:MAG: hypothetical protein ACM3XM_08895 [Mycobacterium leprae]